MRTCPINDCNINEEDPAPCCRDCPLKDRCPDRCQNTEGCNNARSDYI